MNYFGSKKVASKIKVEIRRFSSFSINAFEIQKKECGIAKAWISNLKLNLKCHKAYILFSHFWNLKSQIWNLQKCHLRNTFKKISRFNLFLYIINLRPNNKIKEKRKVLKIFCESQILLFRSQNENNKLHSRKTQNQTFDITCGSIQEWVTHRTDSDTSMSNEKISRTME